MLATALALAFRDPPSGVADGDAGTRHHAPADFLRAEPLAWLLEDVEADVDDVGVRLGMKQVDTPRTKGA